MSRLNIKNMKKIGLTTNLFGLFVYSRDKNSLLKILDSHLMKRENLLSIFTPNPEQIVLAKQDKTFAKYLGYADILIPDGFGLVLASKILSLFAKKKRNKHNEGVILERITGIDLTKELLEIAKKDKLKVLIIGGRDYLERKYNGLEVNKSFDKTKKDSIYWIEGYSEVQNPTAGENKAIISGLKTIQPDMVFVAFGAPFQEKWIIDHKQILKAAKVSIVMAVGGTFDVLLGKVQRAPKWMQTIGLEWLFRLFQEPWRWRRQTKLLKFLSMIIKELSWK